jgi:predicted NUDIX family phosphoesterase
MNVEQVLVIPRSHFNLLGSFQGFSANGSSYLSSFLNPTVNFFMARPEAELDPSHKQLIPYCLFTYNQKILRYRRGSSSGEKRLASKSSIGIGGHINPIDLADQHMTYEGYINALNREIQEELHFQGTFTHEVIGLINDDSSEVGAVHLGVIHLVKLSTDLVRSNEDSIVDIEFLTLAQLQAEKESLESWSQIALNELPRLI